MSSLQVNTESEPWRYACPDCGSIQVHRITSGTRRRDRDYPATGHGQRMAEADRKLRYRCLQCAERIPRVVDRKTGKQVEA